MFFSERYDDLQFNAILNSDFGSLIHVFENEIKTFGFGQISRVKIGVFRVSATVSYRNPMQTIQKPIPRKTSGCAAIITMKSLAVLFPGKAQSFHSVYVIKLHCRSMDFTECAIYSTVNEKTWYFA